MTSPHSSIIAANRRDFRLRHNALVCRIAGDRMMAALDRLGALVAKQFDPDQQRAPAGSPDGGQWVAGNDGGGSDVTRPLVVDVIAYPGIGHNEGPKLEEPPDIPEKDPGRANWLSYAKQAANWLARFFLRRSPIVAAVWAAIEAASWLVGELPSIRSYLDGPKSLEELRLNAQSGRPGYHRHHISEQTPAERDGFPRSLIDGYENVVSVPIYRHRKISAWYQAPNSQFGGASPRQYLRGRDWAERQRVGLQALRDAGVLK